MKKKSKVMIKLFAIFTVFLMLSGCSANKDVVGKYSSKKGRGNIELQKDSTFFYEYRIFHLYEYSVGKWKMLSKNRISFTSEIRSTLVPIIVKQTDNGNNRNGISIDLNIKPNENLSDYGCGVYVNDSLFFVKRCDSVSSLVIDRPIKSIYFLFTKEPQLTTTTAIAPPVFTNKYIPKNSTGNDLKIEISFSDSLFYYKSFDGDSVKVKRNNIIMFDDRAKKWEKLRRVSPELNIFSRFKRDR